MSKSYGYNGAAYLSGSAAAPTKLADNASATAAAATWVEFTSAQNVTINATGEDKDVSTRNSVRGGFKAHDIIVSDSSVTMTFFNDAADTMLKALRTAKFTSAEIGLAFMDGAIATVGSNGLAGNWKVKDFKEGQPIDGMQTIDVEIVPGPSGIMSSYTTAS